MNQWMNLNAHQWELIKLRYMQNTAKLLKKFKVALFHCPEEMTTVWQIKSGRNIHPWASL